MVNCAQDKKNEWFIEDVHLVPEYLRYFVLQCNFAVLYSRTFFAVIMQGAEYHQQHGSTNFKLAEKNILEAKTVHYGLT